MVVFPSLKGMEIPAPSRAGGGIAIPPPARDGAGISIPFRLGNTTMNYLPATPEDRARMLGAIGASSTDELFADVPAGARGRELALPEALSEIEVARLLRDLSEQNLDLVHHPSFLGAGSYV